MHSGTRELGRAEASGLLWQAPRRPSPPCLAALVAAQTLLWALACALAPPPLRLVDFERANTYPCGKVLTGLKNHREWSPMPLPREEHRGVGT